MRRAKPVRHAGPRRAAEHRREAGSLLGIDTGGSCGRAALALGGRIIGRSLEAGLNPNDIGFDLFEERLAELVVPLLETHLASPGSSPRIPRSEGPGKTSRDNRARRRGPLYVAAGIAGAGQPKTMKRCTAILRRILRPYASRLRLKMMTDVEALAEACIGEGPGMVLIAGTGSICVGVANRGGRRVSCRTGGLGALHDRGGGAVMGHMVLAAARAHLEGTARHDLLVKLLCRYSGIKPREIPSHFQHLDRRELAELAKVALEAYDLGDRAAKEIVRATVKSQVRLVLEVREELGLRKDSKIFASGGLFKSPVIRRLFKARIARSLPAARLTFVDDPLLKIMKIMGTAQQP